MTCKGTIKNMGSCGQRNNAVPTPNIWPRSYSRDHCHIAKLEGVNQPRPLCKCHEAGTCFTAQ
jgi:hypothetical protein